MWVQHLLSWHLQRYFLDSLRIAEMLAHEIDDSLEMGGIIDSGVPYPRLRDSEKRSYGFELHLWSLTPLA